MEENKRRDAREITDQREAIIREKRQVTEERRD